MNEDSDPDPYIDERNAEDFAALQPTPLVRISAGVMLMAAVAAAFSAFQLWGILGSRAADWLWMIEAGHFVAAIGAVYFCWQLLRVRAWSTALASGYFGLLALTGGAWFVRAALGGFVSPLGMAVPSLSLPATVLALICLPRAMRAHHARRRLQQRGLSFGL